MSLTTARPSSDFPEVVMDPKSVRIAFAALIPPARTQCKNGLIADSLIERTDGDRLHLCVFKRFEDLPKVPWAEQRVCYFFG